MTHPLLSNQGQYQKAIEEVQIAEGFDDEGKGMEGSRVTALAQKARSERVGPGGTVSFNNHELMSKRVTLNQQSATTNENVKRIKNGQFDMNCLFHVDPDQKLINKMGMMGEHERQTQGPSLANQSVKISIRVEAKIEAPQRGFVLPDLNIIPNKEDLMVSDAATVKKRIKSGKRIPYGEREKIHEERRRERERERRLEAKDVTMGKKMGKLPAAQANPDVVKACVVTTENDQVRKGIVDLLNEYGVMGAVPENWMTVKKGSSKSSYAAKNAPPSCHIWFVNNSQLLYTREPAEDYDSLPPLIPQASNALRSQSLLTLKENYNKLKFDPAPS
ncbi:hypothetical protein Tco_0920465 [Tanacetum coccineum]